MNPDERKPPSPSQMPNPWRSRGYLPHFDQPHLMQSLTFRLYDAVPDSVIEAWKAELRWVKNLSAADPREIKLQKRVLRYEDACHGACWLRDERIAAAVEDSLLFF